MCSDCYVSSLATCECREYECDLTGTATEVEIKPYLILNVKNVNNKEMK